jgi:hypothetical protein
MANLSSSSTTTVSQRLRPQPEPAGQGRAGGEQGQKIAELGDTDSDRPKLHFEIRRQGKPVDPGKYLPR